MSWSLAGAELSALAVACEDDCPGWISFTCGGAGGSSWPVAGSVGFSSFASAGAVGYARSYVARVERGEVLPDESSVRVARDYLEGDQRLMQLYEAARRGPLLMVSRLTP